MGIEELLEQLIVIGWDKIELTARAHDGTTEWQATAVWEGRTFESGWYGTAMSAVKGAVRKPLEIAEEG